MTWNDPERPSVPPPLPALPAEPYDAGPNEAYETQGAPDVPVDAGTNWSLAQRNRVESEWRRLQRAFAYHPHVTVTPLAGEPPSAYQVDYRLTTLIVDDEGKLQYADSAAVQIWLPPEFPNQPPVVRPLIGVFHPNVTWEGVYLSSAWHPSENLVLLVHKIGEVLSFRTWDTQMVANPPAMDWIAANAQGLPLDNAATFDPAADGEPLARICRFGPATLDSIRKSLLQFQKDLLAPEPPDDAATAEFADSTRADLRLFLASDVPEDLSTPADELEEAANALHKDLPIYEHLRVRWTTLRAVRSAAKSVLEARAPLLKELARLASVVDAGEPTEPLVALKLIPDMAVLNPLRLSLPNLIAEAQRRLDVLKSLLKSLATGRQPQVLPSDTFLGRNLDNALDKIAADTTRLQQEAQAVAEACEPVVGRASADHAALERVARWREYVDLVSRARALERRAAEWGADGVQAYYIENESGRFGPFQFGQPVDLGSGDVMVHSAARGQIEVRRAADEHVLGRSADGAVTIDIPAAPGSEGPEKFPTAFQLTERCDDLLVQFDFLRRQTAENLQRKDQETGYTSEIWCGHFCRLLARRPSREALARELAKVSQRWKQTMLDLAALIPFKERLATYFLVNRAAEAAPALVQSLSDAQAALSHSDRRLADIVRHCSHDAETGRLFVPPRYSQAYNKEMDLRAGAEETIQQSTLLLRALTMQLTARLQDPRLLGRGEVPKMSLIAAPTPALTDLPMADGQLGHPIAALEALLQTPLGGPRPGPPPVPEPVTTAAAEQPPETAAEPKAAARNREESRAAHETTEVESQPPVEMEATHAETAGPLVHEAAAPAVEEAPHHQVDAFGFTMDEQERADGSGEVEVESDSVGFHYEPAPKVPPAAGG
jgi:ubiquitin-protein ligase